MIDLPLPLIGIILAVLGYCLTRALAPKTRRPLTEMQPEFEETLLDEKELGNEALDMDIVRAAEAENQRLSYWGGARWGSRVGGSFTDRAFKKYREERDHDRRKQN